MSDETAEIDALLDQLNDLEDELERHRQMIVSVRDEPESFDDDEVETYVEQLDAALEEGDFFAPVEAAAEPLQQVVEQSQREFLASADLIVDGEVVEGGEFLELEPDADPPRARMLVESPMINKLRGGDQRLELDDGRTFTFTVAKTLVADVAEDKTGDLELEMELDER